MFNHLIAVMTRFSPLPRKMEFKQQHFSATSWIYRLRTTASIRAEDLTQAQTWLNITEMADADNIETITAKALIVKAIIVGWKRNKGHEAE